MLGSKSKSGSDSDVKPSTSVRKLPSAAGVSLKREAASVPSGLGLVLKKPRIASQTFTPLGRAIEADRRASPTTQVYLYEEIAAEGSMCCVFELPCFLRDCLALPLLGPFCSWGLSAGYQPRPQVVDRGTTARYGGQLRYI